MDAVSEDRAAQMRQKLKEQWDEAIKKVEGYHVHIYYEEGAESEDQAWQLADELKSLFDRDIEDINAAGPRGPHVLLNVALDISRESFGRIVAWLQLNNNGLSILVHPQTDDGVKDHLQSALWINRELGYRPEFLDMVAKHEQQAPRPG